ncbi:MAG: hypothetical protein LBR91_01845 [Puniceicoccales bacterium]|jgi:hypothetical protein|nr:hypothetical protein [Puniceicoccales bacterium]
MLKLLKFACIFACCVALQSDSVCAVPDNRILVGVPIEGFELPIFGDDGDKTWEVSGTSATMVESGIFHVKNATLRCFAGGCAPEESFRASSDFAMVSSTCHTASGESEVKITGKNFGAYADTWEFFGDSKKIVAKGNVRVFLTESIAEISP